MIGKEIKTFSRKRLSSICLGIEAMNNLLPIIVMFFTVSIVTVKSESGVVMSMDNASYESLSAVPWRRIRDVVQSQDGRKQAQESKFISDSSPILSQLTAVRVGDDATPSVSSTPRKSLVLLRRIRRDQPEVKAPSSMLESANDAVISLLNSPMVRKVPQVAGEAMVGVLRSPMIQKVPQVAGEAMVSFFRSPMIRKIPQAAGEAVLTTLRSPMLREVPQAAGKAIVSFLRSPVLQEVPQAAGEAMVSFFRSPLLREVPHAAGEALLTFFKSPMLREVPHTAGKAVIAFLNPADVPTDASLPKSHRSQATP